MNPAERDRWLTGLKPGDKVMYRRAGSTKTIVEAEVVRRTPTGQIVLKGGRRFRPDGSEITSSSWDRVRIEPSSPELLEEARARVRLFDLRGVNWETVPKDVISEVHDLLVQRGVLQDA